MPSGERTSATPQMPERSMRSRTSSSPGFPGGNSRPARNVASISSPYCTSLAPWTIARNRPWIGDQRSPSESCVELEGEPREDLRPGGSAVARRRSLDRAIRDDAARAEDSGSGGKERGELRRALVGEARTGVGRAAGDHRRQRRRENPAGRRAQEEEEQGRQAERGREGQARRGRKEMPAGNEDARRQGKSNADERASHECELSTGRAS